MKRTWGQRTGGFPAFQRRTRRRFVARRAPARWAGHYRKAGYYGRFGPGRRGDKGPELKFHDLDINVANTATAGVIAEDSCNTIAQDTTESTRVGRKCTIRSINWRWNAVLLDTVSTQVPGTPETTRIILYLDKQTNGVTAAVTDILETADFQSFNNLANKSRFRILMDRSFTLAVTAGAGDGTAANDWTGQGLNDSFYKKCNIPIEYDNTATTGAIATVRSNNIGVLVIGDGTGTSIGSKMRLRFSDS